MRKVIVTIETDVDTNYLERKITQGLEAAGVAFGSVVARPIHEILNKLQAKEDERRKAIEKTDDNSCLIRFCAGSWLVSTRLHEEVCYTIDEVIGYINRNEFYITNETIMTAEYANQLWYKRIS